MSLKNAPLLYVFFEVSDLARQRQLFESRFGLRVIEVEPHMPHHRHGVIKYDAGGLIFSLNLTDATKFRPDATDALASTLEIARGGLDVDEPHDGFLTRRGNELVDGHGHHFRILDGRPASGPGRVTALHLIVDDLPASTRFYRDVLELPIRSREDATSTFIAGKVDLVLEARTAQCKRQLQRAGYLIVFYAPDIVATQEQLVARGARFKRPRPGYSEIGDSSRFDDPEGNHLCLYQPSQECLTWGSGPKVMELAQMEGGIDANRVADSVPVPVRD